eukprot:gene16751-biopygen4636
MVDDGEWWTAGNGGQLEMVGHSPGNGPSISRRLPVHLRRIVHSSPEDGPFTSGKCVVHLRRMLRHAGRRVGCVMGRMGGGGPAVAGQRAVRPGADLHAPTQRLVDPAQRCGNGSYHSSALRPAQLWAAVTAVITALGCGNGALAPSAAHADDVAAEARLEEAPVVRPLAQPEHLLLSLPSEMLRPAPRRRRRATPHAAPPTARRRRRRGRTPPWEMCLSTTDWEMCLSTTDFNCFQVHLPAQREGAARRGRGYGCQVRHGA